MEYRGVDLFFLTNTLDYSQGSPLEANAHDGCGMQMGRASNLRPQQMLWIDLPVGSGGVCMHVNVFLILLRHSL